MSNCGIVEQKGTSKAIRSLLEIMGIKRVYFVDDVYEKVDVEELVASIAVLTPERVDEEIDELKGKFSANQDIWLERIREFIESLSPDRMRGMYDHLKQGDSEAQAGDLSDYQDGEKLKALVGSDLIETLSWTEWQQRRDTLLDGTKGQKSLFLFDQDLSRGGGRKDEGIQIISSIMPPKEDRKYVCGLLTYHILKREQEKRWRELATEHQIQKDLFVVVSKEWLREDHDGFGRMLKIVLLSPVFADMRKRASEIISEASKSAIAQIDAVSVNDFDHIVCDVPHREGNWEPEMLFRLYSVFHQNEIRKLCYGDTTIEETYQHQ